MLPQGLDQISDSKSKKDMIAAAMSTSHDETGTHQHSPRLNQYPIQESEDIRDKTHS